MKRREFIRLVGGAAPLMLRPIAVRAQQPANPLMGWLSNASADVYTVRLGAFRQGLKQVGYIEGQNLDIEYRWAEGQNDRLPVLAAELVQRQVAVIAAAGGTPAALAAKTATQPIPISFADSLIPVPPGLSPTLTHPPPHTT